MLLLVTAMMLATGIVTLIVAMFTRRAPRMDELGTVSSRWIAEHHVDSP
jgi:hypothetical protein